MDRKLTIRNLDAQSRMGADGFREDLMSARHELYASRHPVYHRLAGVILGLISGPETDADVCASFERCWRSRSFPVFYERPLMLMAALRAEAMEEGAGHPLHRALAAQVPEPEVVTTETVSKALGRERVGLWARLTTRRMQTNDTTRAVAWLWPAHLAGCNGGRRPLALVDVGAGAGLNLIADELAATWKDRATGKLVPCATDIEVISRVGYDQRPVNIRSADDLLWMRACIWPGETERLQRFEAAVQAMLAAATGRAPPTIERLTASLVPDRLRATSARLPPRALLLAYQTLVIGYMDAKERESYRRGMFDAIAGRPPGSVLWVELELDDARRRMPAVLMAHVRAGEEVKSLRMARSNQHPTELEIDPVGVAELHRCLAVP